MTLNRIKAHAEQTVSDEAFSERATRWSVDTPDTKEAYFIREIFEGRLRLATAKLVTHQVYFPRTVPY